MGLCALFLSQSRPVTSDRSCPHYGATLGASLTRCIEVAPKPLTDTAIRATKPQAKAVRLFDGGGLYLEVSPAGGKWWRWKYRFGGKENRLSFGVYPDVPLKAARDKRDAARRQLAAGIDTSLARRAVLPLVEN